MPHRILLCLVFLSLVAFAQPVELPYDNSGESWSWSDAGEESAGGSSYLGVDIADVTSERLGELKLKEEHGAEVTMVDQDAPAGKAGLKEHDVILSVNGAAVESAAQLRRMIRETPAGRIVTLGISRDGQPLSIKVQLADRRKSFAVSSNDRMFNFKMPSIPPMPDFDVPVSVVIVHSSLRSGLMVENLTPQLGEFFGVKNGNGVLVRSVEKGSRADKSGFRAGDVIVKVNDQPVHDTSDFTHALRAHSGGPAGVTVMREKKRTEPHSDAPGEERLRQPARRKLRGPRSVGRRRAADEPLRRANGSHPAGPGEDAAENPAAQRSPAKPA